MRLTLLTIALSQTAPAWAAAQGVAPVGPTSETLWAQGFKPVARGELTMERRIVPPMDSGIYAKGDPICDGQTERLNMAMIDGIAPLECAVRAVAVRYGNFVRMVRGAEEYVCIRDRGEKCHRVTAQVAGKQ
ncbi:hypothetical protein BO068_004830 [Escherichia coli]|nr:hypothetical protein [Escherichia coli]